MLTNKLNMPSVFYDALAATQYEDRAALDYSVTQLIASPRQVQLVKRHCADADEDVADIYYAFVGNAMHNQMEEGLKNNPKYIAETRVHRDESVVAGRVHKVGGKPDLYDVESSKLYDYKTSTTYIHGKEAKPEWFDQLNMYAYMLEDSGKPVDQASIIVFYKDWREAASKYKATDDYPVSPVAEFPVKLLTQEERKKFYYDRLNLHIDNESVEDEKLPFCTEEEVWEQPAKYAVYKPGADRAMRLCNTLADAESYIKWKKLPGLEIEFRQGSRNKCKSYCKAAPYCNQYQEWLRAQDAMTANAISSDIKAA